MGLLETALIFLLIGLAACSPFNVSFEVQNAHPEQDAEMEHFSQFLSIIISIPEKCKAANKTAIEEGLDDRFKEATRCIYAKIKPEEFQEEFLAALSSGMINNILEKACTFWPHIHTCLKQIISDTKQCLDAQGQNGLDQTIGLFNDSNNFFCENHQYRMIEFLQHDGIECMQTVNDMDNDTCVVPIFEKNREKKVEFTYNNEDCSDFREIRACITSLTGKCSSDVPGKIIDDYLTLVQRVVCNSSSSLGSQHLESTTYSSVTTNFDFIKPDVQDSEVEKFLDKFQPIMNHFKANCIPANKEAVVQVILDRFKELHSCIHAKINPEEFRKEFEAALRSGVIDEILGKACTFWPHIHTCLKQIISDTKECLDAESQNGLDQTIGLYNDSNNFFCENDQYRMKEFLQHGTECMQSVENYIDTCVKRKGMNFELTFSNKDCSDIHEIHACITSQTGKCSSGVPGKIIDDYLTLVQREVCNSSSSLGSQHLGSATYSPVTTNFDLVEPDVQDFNKMEIFSIRFLPIMNYFEAKCKAANKEAVVQVLKDRFKELHSCIHAKIKPEEFYQEFETAFRRGMIDEILGKVCTFWPQIQTCFKQLISDFKQCLDAESQNGLDQTIGLINDSNNFLCENDQYRMKEFLHHDGIQCVQYVGFDLFTCFEPILEKHVELTYSNEDCRDLQAFGSCVALKASRCRSKVPGKIFKDCLAMVQPVVCKPAPISHRKYFRFKMSVAEIELGTN